MRGRKFLRIGIVEAVPWSYIPDGENEWAGFCIDLINTLAERMDFEYELVVCEDTNTLIVENGTGYDGIIGQLIEGKIDMAIATIVMSAARGQLVNYITPYFENSGISIVMRRPVRKSSFFKFMTVLSFDVWLSIINAIVVTALIIWLIEKLSPACCNVFHEKSGRKFTLRESLWYAVTTFTAQGTGDIPVKTPHRVLIVAYWIFVLVMMTTFTANLAAFLTVERLQTPVSSWWELLRQTRIKYTVVENSHAHFYFKNMKFAEDTLFRIWNDIILSQTAENESDYRTWDYPIKEEYRHALSMIERNTPVPNASFGFQKVLDNEKGEFALIHDTSEIRYHTYRDCNLIEIGEIFGERPYSIAIRQKSRLKYEIHHRILEMHEERYFETLSAKYWNTSNLASCSSSGDEHESVTLDSLGGVFIAVICGIIVALITLMSEVSFDIRNKKRDQNFIPVGCKISNLPRSNIIRQKGTFKSNSRPTLRYERSNLKRTFVRPVSLISKIK